MPVSRPSLETIYQRIKADAESRLTNEVKIARFSMVGILILIFSGAIHLCYGMIVWFGKQLFPDTSTIDYLERDGRLRGIFRKESIYSSGVVTVTGTNGTVIPEGTLFQNSNGIQYETDNEATISGGAVNIPITSTTIGLAGNTDDAELNLVLAIADVDSNAVVYSGCDNGADTESDEQLRRRVLYTYANPPAGGRDSDYKRWAWSITGIDRVWVRDAEDYNGPGTVGIIVSDDAGYPVSSLAKTNAQAYINTQKPLGSVAVVEDVVRNTVQLLIDITPNNASIRSNIDTNLTKLFEDDSEPGINFKLSKIRTAVGKSGVDDFVITEIQVNGSPVALADITVTGFNYLVFDSATCSDL